MDHTTTKALRIGAWQVDPASGLISRDGESARLEARTMRLLLCLAEHPGKVVSIDELLDQAWSGVIVSPDSVYQAVATLRRLLGDDSKQPIYIETVPRLGYRLVATVNVIVDDPDRSAEVTQPANPIVRSHRSGIAKTGLVVISSLVVLIACAFLLHGKLAAKSHSAAQIAVAPLPRKSIAVLPFLDLTQGMKQGEFADGMTEELIDKLSKVPELQVPPPTSSFYFKDKQATVAEIAKALGVAYVLDGSVRKSGDQLRVATRLVRADNGYVVWSETYDRPFRDILMVQDDIAGEVTKALRASIEFQVR